MADKFSYVNSFEEIDAELAAATREINEVVIHWTGHFLDQNPTAEDIDAAHIASGEFSEIAYHYIIHRDGSLQRGRDINKTGAHAGGDRVGSFSRNKYSIGISFVGGVNMTAAEARSQGYITGNGIDWGGLSPWINTQSLTEVQFQTLDGFLDCFFFIFNYGQVTGHMEIPNSQKPDPGFDVAAYCLNKFGRVRVVNPAESGTISTEALLELIDARAQGT